MLAEEMTPLTPLTPQNLSKLFYFKRMPLRGHFPNLRGQRGHTLRSPPGLYRTVFIGAIAVAGLFPELRGHPSSSAGLSALACSGNRMRSYVLGGRRDPGF